MGHFFCLWFVMWSNSKCRNSNSQKSAESKRKPTVFSGKQRVLWSCYPDLNWRPHPYQYADTHFTPYPFVPANTRKSLYRKGLRVIACWPVFPCHTTSVGRFVGKYILTPAKGLMALLCGGYVGAPLYFSNSSKVKPAACVI